MPPGKATSCSLVSAGFVYDCLDGDLSRLNLPERPRRSLEQFSGTLCVDELPLGNYTLLLATDPLADQKCLWASQSLSPGHSRYSFLQIALAR